MADRQWERWVMQTARSWEDLAPIIKETGISSVDHDHRRLTEYALELNNLLLRMEDQFDLNIVEEQQYLLDQFMDYTRYHFRSEEELLKRYELDGLERQQEEHESIIRMLEEIIFEFRTGRITSAFKLRMEILNWVIGHINNTDREVFDFFNICEAILKIDSWEDIRGFIRSVHVPPVDKDHKFLTQAIMQMGRAIRNYHKDGTGGASLLEPMDEVLRQTYRHFKREEELIHRYRIPGEDTQKDQHVKFVRYLEVQIELVRKGDMSKLDELERELLFWWIQHINIYDYRTFRKNFWIGSVFSQARSAEDVIWLISPTGIESIDRDHREFVEILFDLKYLLNPEVDHIKYASECLEELRHLMTYAQAHFHREEEYMTRHECSGKERHIKEHNAIVRQLQEHEEGLTRGLIDLRGQLRNTLLNWWIDHTNGMDFETFGAIYDQ